jgi:hypothetical protein
MYSIFKRNLGLILLLLLINNLSEANFVTISSKDSAINPPLNTTTYNDSFYNSVFEAAVGIAQPYLLQQKYYTMPGVSVDGDSIVYKGVYYPISESYFNPGTGYYISDTSYKTYGVSNFKSIWPTQCPNAFYESATHSFFSKVDCVGFGTRVLSATGGTSATGNAYINLIDRIHANNVTTFASKDYVATAYQFGVAFPTLKTAPQPGWAYISGDVCTSSVIDGYNHVIDASVGTYNGVRKGGFALCQAGDILAFAYDSTASSNGHWMVIESQPQLLDATTLKTYYPKESSTKINAFVIAHRVYAVPVIDDSGEEAHFNDSRASYSGIGHGTVLIVADTADDAPIGFIFAPTTNIAYSAVDTSFCYAISVGRYVTASQLPVSITSFTAVEQNKNIELNWNTAEEVNTKSFNVQHSTDGANFTNIGTVNAIGFGANSYQFTDKSPVNGIDYYRIETLDKDGAVSYSKVVSCELSVVSKQIAVYPNPSRDKVTINGNHIASVQVIDNIGRVVKVVTLKDATNPTLIVSGLASGIYHLSIQTTDGKTSTIGFVKE